MTEARIEHLKELMSRHKIDTIALNPGSTLTYLTGLEFHLMERPTVMLYQKGHKPFMIIPRLESAKLSGSHLKMHSVPFGDDPSTWQEAFRAAFKHMNLEGARIGLETTRMRFMEMNYLQTAAPTARFVPADQIFGDLRVVKDENEIKDMRRAVDIAQQALREVLPKIKPGVTETEIAGELTIAMLRAGSDPELPFSPIVASGPNSANPHAAPTGRKLEPGDLLVIDWGARVNGYCSDLTRTFAIGNLDPELELIYNTVLLANTAGRAAGKPGLAAGEVDCAAREVIDQAGFGEFFTHRTGHGLGMEAHETPYIFTGNSEKLEPGMTYTVEPGIYLPNKGGVRIEDDVLITPDGAISLSDYPRELTIL